MFIGFGCEYVWNISDIPGYGSENNFALHPLWSSWLKRSNFCKFDGILSVICKGSEFLKFS